MQARTLPPDLFASHHAARRRSGRRILRCRGAGPALRAALLAAGIAAAQAGAARAADSVAVAARLHTPPDSHEPQRALVEIRNAGSADLARIPLACAFLGDDGTVLERGTAEAGPVAAGATASAEVIYYGWPRARRVACGRAGS